jgi:hypothetical protein
VVLIHDAGVKRDKSSAYHIDFCILVSYNTCMPILARFYGLIIKMYFQQSEHNPPHIHAVYGEYIGVINIQNCEMIEGDLPQKALALVTEWVQQHQADLLEIWNTQKFKPLAPLE